MNGGNDLPGAQGGPLFAVVAMTLGTLLVWRRGPRAVHKPG